MNDKRCPKRPLESLGTVAFSDASATWALRSQLTCTTWMCASEMREGEKSENECTHTMTRTPLACKFEVISSRSLLSVEA
jgi:hypothetical protein